MLSKQVLSQYLDPLYPVPTHLRQSGILKEKVKCVLFDIYGTLFVSRAGDISIAKKDLKYTRKLEKLFEKYNIRKTPGSVLNRFFAAIEKQHVEMKAQGIDFPEVEIDRVWVSVLENQSMEAARKFAAEFELMVNPVYPMPNLEKMLSRCREKNIITGIISNAQFYTPFLFKWFLGSDMDDLGFCPDLIFFSWQYGHAKPSMCLFDSAAENLKAKAIPKDAVLYIGNDMLKDIYPAQKAGFKTALFAGDSRSLRLRENDPLCKNLSADLVVTDLVQIIDLI